MFQYATVSFLVNDGDGEDKEYVEVVSTSWITDVNTKAFWPEISNKGCTKDKGTRLILSLTPPDPNWPKLRIKLRHCFGELVFIQNLRFGAVPIRYASFGGNFKFRQNYVGKSSKLEIKSV